MGELHGMSSELLFKMIINGDLRVQTKEMDAGDELMPAVRTSHC